MEDPTPCAFPRRRWDVANARPDDAADLARTLGLSPVVGQLLLNRGLADPADARAFLKPTLKSLHDPATLPGLPAAAARIAAAIKANEKVVIYGDYDADGITATAILWHAIRLLGGHAEAYIPHRIDEGYGLNADAVARLCDDGAALIITVDCGVTAIEPARIAKARGVDLIVTDHHEWGKDEGGRMKDEKEKSSLHPSSFRPHPYSRLPDCCAVVHPRLPPEDGNAAYPNPNLCGAGVAFKLAWGVGQAVSGAERVPEALRDFLVEATALAAFGTVADVVPLTGENRAMAHFGLGGLRASKLTGVRALIASAGLDGKALDSYAIGFKLGPRLNAAGRMGHAREALRLLTDADPAEADAIAADLEQHNRSRQATERKMADEAAERAVAEGQVGDGGCAVVVAGEGWHAGVVGIVASRLVDRFDRPAVVIGLCDGRGQGSGRSVAGFHLADALAACGEHLLTHGGHAMAAGLSLRAECVPAFRAAFAAVARQRIDPADLVPRLAVEAECALADVSEALADQVARLGPFGPGNPRPLLLLRNVELANDPRRVGQRGDVLQLLLRHGRATTRAVLFGCPEPVASLRQGAVVDLVVQPKVDEWNGRRRVELEVKDLAVRA